MDIVQYEGVRTPYGEVLDHSRVLVELRLQLLKADCSTVVCISILKQCPGELV